MLWGVAMRKARAQMTMPARFMRALAYSPDGKTVASGSDDKTVRLWDVPAPK